MASILDTYLNKNLHDGNGLNEQPFGNILRVPWSSWEKVNQSPETNCLEETAMFNP